MKHLKTLEKFKEEDFDDFIKIEKTRLLQRFGDKNIINFITDGDLDGIKYLINNGYDIDKKDFDLNLITLALNKNQLDVFEYLLKTNYLQEWGLGNTIQSISLPDIIGIKQYSTNNHIDKDMVDKLKIITNHGFNFNDDHNLIELYLCEFSNKTISHKILIDGVEPFIDWLLENYPINFSLCKDILTEELKIKYKYLYDSEKYNI